MFEIKSEYGIVYMKEGKRETTLENFASNKDALAMVKHIKEDIAEYVNEGRNEKWIRKVIIEDHKVD